MPNPPRTPEDLAFRCEREEPSRELDAEIARSLGWKPQSFARPTDDGFYWDTPDGDFRPLPRYTASIDAAVSLAPPIGTIARGPSCQWQVSFGLYPTDISSVKAAIATAKPTYRAMAILGHDGRQQHEISAMGRTAALALCAVLLRARAAQEAEGG